MELKRTLANLTTEMRNEATANIDTSTTTEIVTLITREDEHVLRAVQESIPQMVQAADLFTEVLKQGGRIFYMGSGTSGRLGVLDAAELLPTFGVGEDQVKALIAGGTRAMFIPVEHAEDDEEAGLADFLALNPGPKDALLGITASGRTPYVLAPLKKARELGLVTVGLTCNKGSEIAEIAQVTIAPVVGPEVVTGSTRMKAGTAQKIVLNTLSTTVMIKIGKVYQNLMVDMSPTNEKLRERAVHIVSEATGITIDEARDALSQAEYNIKAAIVMVVGQCSLEKALALLEQAEGVVGKAIQIIVKETENK